MKNPVELVSLSLQETPIEIDSIVAKLHTLRAASLENRQRKNLSLKLPTPRALTSVIEKLTAVLFPNRLGSPKLINENTDHYVKKILNEALQEMLTQVYWELNHISNLEAYNVKIHKQATAIIRAFAEKLPSIRTLLDEDISAAYEGDPAAHSVDEVLICYPGITAIMYYRIAHELYCLNAPLIARIISEIAHSTTGIEIHPGAKIGSSFFIDHGTGVVIGETSIIGKNVRLYQAVTLGAKRFPADENGALVKNIARHPIVEDDVVIYANATILGRITIGQGSTIGGNVWLTHSVPPNSSISQTRAHKGTP
ncbi:serine O-acetyltransferase [Nitrosomonadaceae bacterium]|nr:serine acetyltransferase [Nitrosospira sp.]MDW7643245.1 serine O-acetyltransferase EpsC [Nitrosomonadaceae bacterium]MBI0417577.1 serine acetyltransferase [Nitrosospira sp.]MDW7652547.1 serine O-acetyltransferase EpsC [Nitrosomonadaceae bacterium]MDW7663914.1 serine O-acetyltransferase EpsC [Nitrosomonadaceae bacterium]